MTVLILVPDILTELLFEWLTLHEICNFNMAVCNTKDRVKLLNVLNIKCSLISHDEFDTCLHQMHIISQDKHLNTVKYVIKVINHTQDRDLIEKFDITGS